MSDKARPKFSFSKKLSGGEFLNVAVWPGKSNPDIYIQQKRDAKSGSRRARL